MTKATKNLGLLALLMASMTLAGCNDSGGSGSGASGGGSGSGDNTDNGDFDDTSGLAITETIPAAGAIGVDLQPTITAIFNADVGGSDQDDKLDLFLHSTKVSTNKSTLGAPADRVTLTPQSALERGTTYTVRIAGDFEDDNFRTLGTAFEWTFSTVDKTFGSVVIVNGQEPGHSSEGSSILVDDEGGRSPVVAIDRNGNLMAVWVDKKSSTAFDVWSRYYDADGDSWLAPHRLLESGTSENSSSVGPYTPAVGMDGDGNAIVVTHDRDGNDHRMLGYHFDAGTQTWAGAPVVIGLEENVEEAINGDNVDFQSPSLYVAESGRALVAWTQHRTAQSVTGRHTIWAAVYDGSDWATATAMSETGKLAVLPSVALDEQGNGMVIWNQRIETGLSDDFSTYARGVDSDGNWDAATVRLEDRSDTDRQNQTRLIALGDGEFMAIWRPRAIKAIRASHFDGANWSDAETIGDFYIDLGFGPIFDAVKTSNGDVLVAWQHHRNGQLVTPSETIPRNVHEYSIWSNGNWSDAEPLANTDNVVQDNINQDVTLAALDNGMVLMARFGKLSGGSDDRVFVQSFQDGTWSPFATVPGCFGDRAKKPLLATGGNEAVLLTTHGDVCVYFYE